MSRTAIRAVFFAGAALIGWFTVNRDGPDAPRPGALIDEQAAAAITWRRPDTLGRGETLGKLLERGGLGPVETQAILAAAPMLDPRRLRAGLAVEFHGQDDDSAPANALRIKLAIDHYVHLERDSAGAWAAREERLPWTTDTVVVTGAVSSSLYQALAEAAGASFPGQANTELAWNLADVYEHRVDMSRDLQPGDSVYALIERSRGPEDATKVGRVLAASLFVGGKPIDAVYFPDDEGRPKYYDRNGKSLATQFLQNPVQFRRISSNFGSRRHPILNTMRMHNGTDYAAATGTPVRAIGDGRVLRLRFERGYGNVVDVQHANGYVSRYAHLSRFAKGLRSGDAVRMGEEIGFVGATGLATGPHLHFEVLVKGKATDPRRVLRNTDGTPLPAKHLAAFARQRDGALLAMGRPALTGPALARAD